MASHINYKSTMKKRNSSGLTLIELLVAVAIFAVLAVVAVPNMKSFMRSNRLTSATNDLVTSLNLARSEAVKRAVSIKTCISNATQDDCDTGTTNWENGWITFIDDNNDDAIDAGEKVLRVSGSVAGGTTIRSPQFASTITYNGAGGASSIGSFKICDEDASAARARGINIALSGLISLAKDTGGATTKNIYTSGTTWGEISCP